LPRQSRRARMQHPGARKRTEPAIPRHLYESSTRTLTEPAESPSVREDDFAVEPERPETPVRLNRFRAPATPAARSNAPVTGVFANRTQAPVAARLASTDYGYVVGELKRIFITALIIVILLVVVALLRR